MPQHTVQNTEVLEHHDRGSTCIGASALASRAGTGARAPGRTAPRLRRWARASRRSAGLRSSSTRRGTACGRGHGGIDVETEQRRLQTGGEGVSARCRRRSWGFIAFCDVCRAFQKIFTEFQGVLGGPSAQRSNVSLFASRGLSSSGAAACKCDLEPAPPISVSALRNS